MMKKDIEVLEIENFSEPDTSLLGLDEELKTKQRRKKIIKVISTILVIILLVFLVLYGPYKGFKNWLIDNASNNKFIGITTFLYGSDAINEEVNKNYVKEPLENTDPNMITFIKEKASNKYEEEILNVTDDYKILKINEKGLKGYLAVIYDASKIGLENDYSQILTKKLAINTDSNLNGSIQGIFIKNEKLIADNARANVGGGIIGFNNENKLILGKYTSSEALKLKVKNAIEYGPFLIVNGKIATISGNGGWGNDDKSAIAQRKDGIVLFLYLKKATLNDTLTTLINYGAYNAANLPSGENSILMKNGKSLGPKNANITSAFVLEN